MSHLLLKMAKLSSAEWQAALETCCGIVEATQNPSDRGGISQWCDEDNLLAMLRAMSGDIVLGKALCLHKLN